MHRVLGMLLQSRSPVWVSSEKIQRTRALYLKAGAEPCGSHNTRRTAKHSANMHHATRAHTHAVTDAHTRFVSMCCECRRVQSPKIKQHKVQRRSVSFALVSPFRVQFGNPQAAWYWRRRVCSTLVFVYQVKVGRRRITWDTRRHLTFRREQLVCVFFNGH